MLSLKEDLKVRSEEEVKVSSQVSSEMSSIYYEEQIELLEQEKKKLNEQIDLLNAEKVDLLQNLEEIKNEKMDLNNKLESYIQVQNCFYSAKMYVNCKLAGKYGAYR